MLFGAKTDVGKVRELNEDSFGCKDGLYVVADGMGGHKAGEVASMIAVETLLLRDPRTLTKNKLEKDIACANENVLHVAVEDLSCKGMGTTLALLAVVNANEAFLANVGDSRIYRWRKDSGLELLTEDHTIAFELVRSGGLTEEEMRNHPKRNVLTKALGAEATVVPAINRIELQMGDRFLLCSDGLSTMLTKEEIAECMASEATPQEIADCLVEAANANGGNDNITAIVLKNE